MITSLVRKERPGDAKVYYATTSVCPGCSKLVPARVVGRDDGVFVERECPDHGFFAGIVCSDRAWWDSLPRFDVPPVKPRNPLRAVDQGCPSDCGLCTSHRQIAGTAAIEISNRCNANCPVCLADNKGTFDVTPAEVRSMIEGLMKRQDRVDALTLSGGEPTIHPQLFEIIAEAERFPGVARIALNSNGVRIAQDDAFLDELKKHPKVYVSLHFDGSGARALRGIDHSLQERALDRLDRWGIDAAPLVLVARGVNDGELGELCNSLLLRPSVRSVVVSLMTYAGHGGLTFAGDAMTRLTIPGALDAIESGTRSALRKTDFMPLPMPNPMCAAIGYFLVDTGTITPLIPLGDLDDVIESTKNANFARVDRDLEGLLRDAIDKLWAESDRTPERDRLLVRFRDLLVRLFPDDGSVTDDERREIVEERVKTVYLFQLMDAWSFDSVRLAKCSCQHLFPDGSVIPSCGYYAYHRQFDARFAGVAR